MYIPGEGVHFTSIVVPFYGVLCLLGILKIPNHVCLVLSTFLTLYEAGILWR